MDLHTVPRECLNMVSLYSSKYFRESIEEISCDQITEIYPVSWVEHCEGITNLAKMLCKFSDLRKIKYMHQMQNIYHKHSVAIYSCIHNACKHGQIHVVKWLFKNKFSGSIRSVDAESLLLAACANLHKKTAEWIYNESPLYFQGRCHHFTDKMFCINCTQGNLEVAQLVHEIAPVSACEIDDNSVVEKVCGQGHLHVLEWISDNFDCEICEYPVNKAFRKAAINGHIEIVEWLDEVYGIDIREVTAEDNYVLRKVVERGHKKVYEFLYEKALEGFEYGGDGRINDMCSDIIDCLFM